VTVAVPRLDSFDDSVFADFRAPSAPAALADQEDDYPRAVCVPKPTR
jgi:hypothetical protein